MIFKKAIHWPNFETWIVQRFEQNWNSWRLAFEMETFYDLTKSSWRQFLQLKTCKWFEKNWNCRRLVLRFDEKFWTTIFATWEVQMNLNKIGILDYFEILINNNLTKSSCRQLIVSWEVQTFWTKLEFLITCIWNAHQ